MAESAQRVRGPARRRYVRWLPAAAAVLLVLAAGVGLASLRSPVGEADGTGAVGQVAAGEDLRTTIRVGTYNIHRCRGTDGRRDLARTARQIDGLDLVGLNEVAGAGPAGGGDQAALLGAATRMAHLFAPTERRWMRCYFGNGLLTALPVERWQRRRLPGTLHRRFRNYLLAIVRAGGRRVHVIITHVDRGPDRHDQLRTVADLFLRLPAPAILLGDLNTDEADPVLAAILTAEGVGDPVGEVLGGKARGRVDYLLVRGLETVDAGLRWSEASDHPVAWAELRLRPSGAAGTRPRSGPGVERGGAGE